MEEEIVAPDFEIGITGEKSPEDVWHSDSGSSDREGAQESAPETRERKTEANTETQLRKLLNIGKSTTGAAESTPRQRSKQRRISRSRSVTASNTPVEDQEMGKPRYTCPTEIAEIFAQEISPEDLCSLSAMKHGTPSAVREVMPNATVKQVCQMCKL